MADGFTCPWCQNDPAARAGCRACNGAGVIGSHDMPEAAAPPLPADPDEGRPIQLVQIAPHGETLWVLDFAGRVWRLMRVDGGGFGSVPDFEWQRIPGPTE